MSSDLLVMKFINHMAWRRGNRWLHLTTWLQCLTARNGKRWPSWLVDFPLQYSLPYQSALASLPSWGMCNNYTPNTLCPPFPQYKEQKGQYFLLTTILDLNCDRTEDMRRWWWPVHFNALICFMQNAPHCWHRQELRRDGENCIPKQTDLSVGLSGGVGYICWNA